MASQFEKLTARAVAGDVEAIQRLPEAAKLFLESTWTPRTRPDDRAALERNVAAEMALEVAEQILGDAARKCCDAGRDRDADDCERARRLLPGSMP